MITSLKEMLELPNFGHMNKSTVKFELRDKFLLVTSQAEVMTLQPLFQNTFILRRFRVANFADIIKYSTMFTKATFEVQSKKGK